MHKQGRRIVVVVALAASAVGLSGCAGLGLTGSMGAMSAEQLKALANDKSSAAACTQYVGTGGTFTAFYMNNDKTFGTAGGTTTIKCGAAEASFADEGKAAKGGSGGSAATPRPAPP